MQNDELNITKFIVQALSDDYESIATLGNYYKEPGPGMPRFSETEITQALTELIAKGIVQPHLYSESHKKLQACEFVAASAEKYWFSLTTKRKKIRLQLLDEAKQ